MAELALREGQDDFLFNNGLTVALVGIDVNPLVGAEAMTDNGASHKVLYLLHAHALMQFLHGRGVNNIALLFGRVVDERQVGVAACT